MTKKPDKHTQAITRHQVITSIKDSDLPEEFLSVNLGKQIVKMGCRMLQYRDKDTRQIILEIPSLDVTGYGATEEKAKEMIDFCLHDYFIFLMSLSQKKLDDEMTRHGWKRRPYANKQFSKAFVNPEGELENFNAVAGEVEIRTVTV